MTKPRLARVLSIDGGGVRALLAARLLVHIEEVTGQSIASNFDLIVASGSGALLATLLTLPGNDGRPRYTAREVLELFKSNARRIFPTGDWSSWLRSMDPFYPGGRFSNEGLVSFCGQTFGELPISSLLIPVTLLACDITTRSPVLLRREGVTADLRLRDCAIACASTPGFFPPWVVGGVSCVDGIVVASNPSLMAHWEARGMFPGARDLLLISLGCGSVERTVSHAEASSWSTAEWLSPLLSACVESSGAAVHVLMQQLASEPPRAPRASSPSVLPLPGISGSRRQGILYRRYQPRIALPVGRAGEPSDADKPTLEFLEISAEAFIRENEESFAALAHVVAQGRPAHPRAAGRRSPGERPRAYSSGAFYSSGALSPGSSSGALSPRGAALSGRGGPASHFDPSIPFFAEGGLGAGRTFPGPIHAPFAPAPPPGPALHPYGATYPWDRQGRPVEASPLLRLLSCGGVCSSACDTQQGARAHRAVYTDRYSTSF
eukprot:tig00021617_g22929.t1